MLWARLNDTMPLADHDQQRPGAGCAVALPSLTPVNQPLPTAYAKVQIVDEWGQVGTASFGALLVQGELLDGWGLGDLALRCQR